MLQSEINVKNCNLTRNVATRAVQTDLQNIHCPLVSRGGFFNRYSDVLQCKYLGGGMCLPGLHYGALISGVELEGQFHGGGKGA